MKDDWTAEEVKKRLGEAMWTIARMPDKDRSFLFPKGSNMPETIYEIRDHMGRRRFCTGYDSEAAKAKLERSTRVQPTARQISDMHKCLNWLWEAPISEQERRVLVAASTCRGKYRTTVPWRAVLNVLPWPEIHRSTLWRHYKRAASKIAAWLNDPGARRGAT